VGGEVRMGEWGNRGMGIRGRQGRGEGRKAERVGW